MHRTNAEMLLHALLLESFLVEYGEAVGTAPTHDAPVLVVLHGSYAHLKYAPKFLQEAVDPTLLTHYSMLFAWTLENTLITAV